MMLAAIILAVITVKTVLIVGLCMRFRRVPHRMPLGRKVVEPVRDRAVR